MTQVNQFYLRTRLIIASCALQDAVKEREAIWWAWQVFIDINIQILRSILTTSMMCGSAFLLSMVKSNTENEQGSDRLKNITLDECKWLPSMIWLDNASWNVTWSLSVFSKKRGLLPLWLEYYLAW